MKGAGKSLRSERILTKIGFKVGEKEGKKILFKGTDIMQIIGSFLCIDQVHRQSHGTN